MFLSTSLDKPLITLSLLFMFFLTFSPMSTTFCCIPAILCERSIMFISLILHNSILFIEESSYRSLIGRDVRKDGITFTRPTRVTHPWASFMESNYLKCNISLNNEKTNPPLEKYFGEVESNLLKAICSSTNFRVVTLSN